MMLETDEKLLPLIIMCNNEVVTLLRGLPRVNMALFKIDKKK